MELSIPLIKTFVSFKYGGFLTGTIAGLASFAIMEFNTQNTVLALIVSALSSALVAYFGYKPKIITATSQAKISESELLGKQTAALIEKLKKNADDKEAICEYQTAARHRIQNFYQASVSHINYLELWAKDHNLQIPSFTPGNVAEVLDTLDAKIEALNEMK